jgi:hypothetical protein
MRFLSYKGWNSDRPRNRQRCDYGREQRRQGDDNDYRKNACPQRRPDLLGSGRSLVKFGSFGRNLWFSYFMGNLQVGQGLRNDPLSRPLYVEESPT